MQAAGFNQNGNYLTVQLKQHQNFGPSQIRLQVVSDKIIRLADWFGIEHIFASRDTADMYSPKVS